MKKIFLSICVIVSLLVTGCVYATEVKVKINGKIINFEDTNAQIINDRTMVPFRKIFNELGVDNDNINWNGDTKIIIAKKNETEIKLQIGNSIAEKKIDNNTIEITLDSVPVIVNGRTLVPLRFIAESLGKNVSWDQNTKTAIINDDDYVDENINTTINMSSDDYYMNAIKNKSIGLYNFLNNKSANIKVSITRKYTDLENANNNNAANVNIDITETQKNNVLHQDVVASFSGSNDLMKDIASEGWANIHYENDYYDTYFTTKALNEGLKKVYGQEQLKFLYTGLNCNGKNTNTLSDMLKEISSNEKNILNEQSAKDEFDNLLSKLKVNENGELITGNISSDSISMDYFDLTKLDNTMFDSPFNRVWCFLNSQIFNYDITWEELRYDYPTINFKINSNNYELLIDFILLNEYNEKVEYIIKINK